VETLRVEKKLAADRARAREAELREKVELALEREGQAKAEMQALDSKLEALRIMAEEASAGAVGDSQAKLLRQLETLQSQYAAARENWQGIEASLVSRAATLERERDEAVRRESEMRRKAKELVLIP
jgi:TATA element modulatory factor